MASIEMETVRGRRVYVQYGQENDVRSASGCLCIQEGLCTGVPRTSNGSRHLLGCPASFLSNHSTEGVRSEGVRTGRRRSGGRVDAGAVLVLGELALEALPVARGHLAEVVLAVLRELLPPCANDLGERAKVDLPVRLAVPALLGPVLVPVVVKELLLLLLGPLDLPAVKDAVCDGKRSKKTNCRLEE